MDLIEKGRRVRTVPIPHWVKDTGAAQEETVKSTQRFVIVTGDPDLTIRTKRSDPLRQLASCFSTSSFKLCDFAEHRDFVQMWPTGLDGNLKSSHSASILFQLPNLKNGDRRPMMDAKEQKLRALEAFKDWSNYMLVTTVAALGWVASKDSPHFSSCWTRTWCIWSLTLSIFFAVLTLALVPHIAEIIDGNKSIYAIKWRGWWPGWELFYLCFPSHVFFLAGVLFYAIGQTTSHSVTMGSSWALL